MENDNFDKQKGNAGTFKERRVEQQRYIKMMQGAQPLSWFLKYVKESVPAGQYLPGIEYLEEPFEGKNAKYYLGACGLELWITIRTEDEEFFSASLSDAAVDERIGPEVLGFAYVAIDNLMETFPEYEKESLGAGDGVISVIEIIDIMVPVASIRREKVWPAQDLCDLNAIFALCPQEELAEMLMNIAESPLPLNKMKISESDLMAYPLGAIFVELLNRPVGEVIFRIREIFHNI